MNILVTGCGGFVGPWAARELVACGHRVFGAGLEAAPLDALEGGAVVACDFRDEKQCEELLSSTHPDAVLHLAGQSHVGYSWVNPAETAESNITAAVAVYEAARATRVAKFVFVSTSEVYGIVAPTQLPLREDTAVNPSNPYAATKLGAEVLLRSLALREGTPALTIVRPFSHTGPGQTPRFVCPSLAEQVAMFALGFAERISHGNLSPKRDYSDVRDVARAYRMILEGDFRGRTFHVASGVSREIEAILVELLEIAGCPNAPREVDPKKLRPVEIPELRGDISALRTATGWQPAVPFRQTLKDLYREAYERLEQTATSTPR